MSRVPLEGFTHTKDNSIDNALKIIENLNETEKVS